MTKIVDQDVNSARKLIEKGGLVFNKNLLNVISWKLPKNILQNL